MTEISKWFKKYKGFSSIYYKLTEHKLDNDAVIKFIIRLYGASSKVTILTIKNKSFDSSIVFENFTIAYKKKELTITEVFGENSIVFKLNRVVSSDHTSHTKFTGNLEVSVY